MRQHIFVRPARQNEAKQVIDWSLATKNNLYDADVIKYPSTVTFCAFNKDKVVLFCPVQKPFVLEALAINPNADKLEIAIAMKEVVQEVVSQAYVQGVPEIMFLCADDSTAEFAKAQAFEELPYRFFRLKLKDLEPNEDKR